jgi:Bax protein
MLLRKVGGCLAAFLLLGGFTLPVSPVGSTAQIGVPREIPQLQCVPTKETFIDCVSLMIGRINDQIVEDRKTLQSISAAVKCGYTAIDAPASEWLLHKLVEYQVDNLRDLDERMRPVPVELAVAQSAVETGWGTSHAAKERHNLFGFVSQTDSPVPFLGTYSSAVAYVHTLNVHRAYSGFRRTRLETDDAHVLAGTLTRYSILGKDYTKFIQSIIRDIRNHVHPAQKQS